MHDRALRWLRCHGYATLVPVEDRSNESPEDDPLTSRLRVASAQGTLATLWDPAGPTADDTNHDEAPFRVRPRRWAARCEGFDLHAGVTVTQGHRVGLERILRYAARPSVAISGQWSAVSPERNTRDHLGSPASR